jgi:pyruvate/2-oxoglutarate dehydrogenase complex dihydrolipoamide dehydrogenase (E3) component
MTEQVDVVVIGMGVGGEAVAGQLAEAPSLWLFTRRCQSARYGT